MNEVATQQEENVEDKSKERHWTLVLGNAAMILLSLFFLISTSIWYRLESLGAVDGLHRELPLAFFLVISFLAICQIAVDYYKRQRVNLIEFLVVIPFLGWYLFEVLFGLLSYNYFFLPSFLTALGISVGIAVLLTLGSELLVRKLREMTVQDRSLILNSFGTLVLAIVIFAIFS